MKFLCVLFFFLISLNSSKAFFTIGSSGKGFSSNEVSIYLSETDCSNTGRTTSEVLSLVKDAVDEYWNRVPTSALELNVKGTTSTSVAGLSLSEMLSLSSTNTILIGCNETGVDDFAAGGTLGVALMNCNGKNCAAAVAINAHPNTYLNTFDKDEFKAVIAHEIGHAFGLGHSTEKLSLMYYSVGGKYQAWLGQDDIDGVTYLYPKEGKLSCLLGEVGSLRKIGPGSHDGSHHHDSHSQDKLSTDAENNDLQHLSLINWLNQGTTQFLMMLAFLFGFRWFVMMKPSKR